MPGGLLRILRCGSGAGAFLEKTERACGEDGHGVHGLAGLGSEGDGVVVETGFFAGADFALIGNDAVADFAGPGGHVDDGDVNEDHECDAHADRGDPLQTAVGNDKERGDGSNRQNQPDRTAQVQDTEDPFFLFFGSVTECERRNIDIHGANSLFRCNSITSRGRGQIEARRPRREKQIASTPAESGKGKLTRFRDEKIVLFRAGILYNEINSVMTAE